MQYTHDKATLEPFILKMMLENATFLTTYGSKLSSSIFSEEYKKLSACILHFYKEKKTNPNRTILEKVYLPKLYEDEEERVKALSMLSDLYKLDVSHNDITTALRTEIGSFIQERHILNKLVAAYSELTTNKNKDACLTILKEAFNTQVDESLGLDYFPDLEARGIRMAQLEDPFIPTGMESMDALIGAGYRKKALYVFAGPANSGKSLILNDAAVNLVTRGFNVLYVCLELSEDYVAQRTDAKFGEISMNQLNLNPVDGINKALAKYKAQQESGKKIGTLWYKEWAPNAAKYTDIVSLMKNVESKKNMKFDFVIIDYLRLLNCAGKVYGDSMYSKLTIICEEVRRLAMEENVCVLSASQTNRESYGSSAPGMENLSDSIGIAQTADCIITIGRDASLDKEDMVLLSVAKSRFSKRGTQFIVKADYDFMRLIDINAGSSYKDMMNKKTSVNKPSTPAEKPPEKQKRGDDFQLDI